MRAVGFEELTGGAPAGVDEALGLVDGFDAALTSGFGRLGAEQSAALAAFAGALAGSPLGGPAAEAVEKIVAGAVAEAHLLTLAGARTALLGSVHDALLAGLDGAAGRTRAECAAVGGDDIAANLLAGCRSWLAELAIAGWRGVDHDLVSAADQFVEGLLKEPRLRGAAVLLDGLAAELRASSPVATMETIPERRWADLWARGMLLTRSGAAATAADEVSGRLLVLGADVHEHGTSVQVQVHGVLEADGGARLVRTSVAAPKVDTITGPQLWRLLDACPTLLKALAERRCLNVTDMPLRPSGDLIWDDGKARAGKEVDPFAMARVQLAEAVAPGVPPLDRHPVRIAEPVFLEGYTVNGTSLELDGRAVDIDFERLPACGPVTPELVRASSSCIGLVRWDGGVWRVQPLAVQATVRKKPVDACTGDWALGPTDPKVLKAANRTGDAVGVLRERAGRLLRK
ncbi:hypothetical protein BJF79_33695 [Actinomadura sp. CNU-125]|uniref:hypothetical protein n=1 Tax=Actinomadura sp. CNU-125 TaxID=1904961 RepID=UPI000961C9D0|nr:hypothetical protein [Actinomadura sp. CNU-125]OLT34133.1 hypothetical protein BJF79_33695 [Actinomadura sp. CNU-125]